MKTQEQLEAELLFWKNLALEMLREQGEAAAYSRLSQTAERIKAANSPTRRFWRSLWETAR